MAKPLTVDDLRVQLSSLDSFKRDPFAIFRSISSLINSPDAEDVAREMVLRALEWEDGIPEYREVLSALARQVGLFPYASQDMLSLRDSIAYEFHRPANMPKPFVFHREQAYVYRRLLAGDSVILSAPTSFGKSRIIDAMIATRRYKNIAVIVPTLALIDETRRRLAVFSDDYKVVTHLSQPPAEANIFVFTAERAVAYEKLPRVDFFAIDEFYKLDAGDEDEPRTVALNEAFYRLRKAGGQFYMLGPNIRQIPVGFESAFRCFFYPMSFSTVVVETRRVPGRGKDVSRLVEVAKSLTEPTLIFCKSPARVNEVARALLDVTERSESRELENASRWIGRTFHPDWVLAQGLPHGIGIHHGRLPRSLAQYVVRAFNREKLRFLVCTSTLIEGVNTKAKNVLIWDNAIARRPIDYFTFNNIKGRSGRMFEHFVGRVFLFDSPPQEELPFVDVPVFTQGEAAPESLLIQIDDADLSEGSRDRLKKYSDESVLPLEVLRQNRGVDPAAQIALARHIFSNATLLSPMLAWSRFPRYEQLEAVCELIWSFLVPAQRRSGVFSSRQLAFKTRQISEKSTIASRVERELKSGKYSAKSPDEAVERVLSFDRSWAGFELPRLLMAVSRIQHAVFEKQKLIAGDYSVFAALTENLFRAPVITALEEYGVPLQAAEKLLDSLETEDDLDEALENLRTLDVASTSLTPFERQLVRDAQRAI